MDSPLTLLVYVLLGVAGGRLVDAIVAYTQAHCGNKYLCLLVALLPIVLFPLALQGLGQAAFVSEWTLTLSGLWFVVLFFAMQRHALSVLSTFTLN